MTEPIYRIVPDKEYVNTKEFSKIINMKIHNIWNWSSKIISEGRDGQPDHLKYFPKRYGNGNKRVIYYDKEEVLAYRDKYISDYKKLLSDSKIRKPVKQSADMIGLTMMMMISDLSRGKLTEYLKKRYRFTEYGEECDEEYKNFPEVSIVDSYMHVNRDDFIEWENKRREFKTDSVVPEDEAISCWKEFIYGKRRKEDNDDKERTR